MNGTSWLLGGGYPWHTGSASDGETGALQLAIAANDEVGLSLATLPNGVFGLASPDDSLGRLTLPRGVAAENGEIYLLSRDGSLVSRYDSANAGFVLLPHVGAEGLCGDQDDAVYLEPRRFRGAKNIAVLRGELYVADANAHRIQVFELRTLALLRILDLVDPIDVTASKEAVYMIDRGAGRAYRAEPGTDCISVVVDPHDPCRTRHWDRIAVDNEERVYLRYRNCETTELDVFATRACPYVEHACEHIYDSAQVRDRFDPPAITSDSPILNPQKSPPTWPRPAYVEHGVWTSEWLDSDIYDCVWHVIELSLARMPPGSRILVRTRTSNEAQSRAEVLASADTVGQLGSWGDTQALVGAPQPDPDAPETFDTDVLVPSAPGQFLQLQIVLDGNGVTTPVVRRVRLRFPRESLLQYLPAVYSSPPEQREFLERYLSIIQTTWSGIEREVDTFERYLDPDSVPDNALPYLASWLDVQLEGTWNAAQNRRLLKVMPGLRPRWGTLAGMRDWLRVYLANLGDLGEQDLERLGIPGIVESFVDRRRLRLNAGGATLCNADGLWSPTVERRFRVGVFDRAGEIELVSTGDPELDVFQHYAHSFRVYVPAMLVRTPDDEALIRRAIETQKPAHATYELVLVEPRFRIGDQSTLDLDTIIGAPLPAGLLCGEDAPGRPPHQRLNFDMTLGCGCDSDESRLERSLA
jgi:phage tail-like protein